jgi:hypothetical protein
MSESEMFRNLNKFSQSMQIFKGSSEDPEAPEDPIVESSDYWVKSKQAHSECAPGKGRRQNRR